MILQTQTFSAADVPRRIWCLSDRQRNRAVVVSGFHANANARTDSLFLEEFQELAVTLVNAGDHIF